MMSETSALFFLLFDKGGILNVAGLLPSRRGARLPSCLASRPRRLREKQIGVGGLRTTGSATGDGRCGGSGLGRVWPRARREDHRHESGLALRADDRGPVQIVELRTATGAKALGAKIGFSHVKRSVELVWKIRCFTWLVAPPVNSGKHAQDGKSPDPDDGPRCMVGGTVFGIPMTDAAQPLTSRRGGPLTGRIRVPGDKSISHRALILGALTVGENHHYRPAGRRGRPPHRCRDARSGRAASHARGDDGSLAGARGRGWWLHVGPCAPLNFGNSGTGCRLALGALAGSPIPASVDGDASLRSRPMKRVLDPLEKMGAKTREAAARRTAADTHPGPSELYPIEYGPPA